MGAPHQSIICYRPILRECKIRPVAAESQACIRRNTEEKASRVAGLENHAPKPLVICFLSRLLTGTCLRVWQSQYLLTDQRA